VIVRVSIVVVALALLSVPVAAQPAKPSCTLVAARVLARGQTLALDDIGVAEGGNVALCAQRSALVGSQTRRVINAGEILRAPAVAPPDLIAPNDPVTVVYRDAGIEIHVKGVAANAAPLGGRVTVRIDVRRRLDGVAVAPGVVQVK